MTVRDLINMLKAYDDDTEVVIGIRQTRGSDFAYDIDFDVEEHDVHAFYDADYKAIVITEGEQCGVVDYNN